MKKPILEALILKNREVIAAGAKHNTELMRIGSAIKTAIFLRQALSKRDADRVIKQHLKKHGAADRWLKVDWGKFVNQAVGAVASHDDHEVIRDLTQVVVSNIVMGRNLETGAVYKAGPLWKRLKAQEDKGLKENDIRKVIMYNMQQIATTYYRSRFGKSSPLNLNDPDSGVEQRLDALLSLDTTTRGFAGEWMSLSKEDPDLRSALRMVDRLIMQNGDEAMKLVWQVLKENPKIKSINQLHKETVVIVDPRTGMPKRVNLVDALIDGGYTKTKGRQAVTWQIKKIRKVLDKVRPAVLDLLRDR